MNPLKLKSWSPYVAGAGIGVLSWFAFITADHPLGVSSSFENTIGVVEKSAWPDAAANNDYFQQHDPKIDWEWMLVLGVFFGGLISARFSGDHTRLKIPPLWRHRFGDSVALRFTGAFLGAAIMMFGARLARGCTSGHGISGNLQLAVASWIFTAVMFLTAIIVAFLIYGKEGRNHV